jgi:hypothetical protein
MANGRWRWHEGGAIFTNHMNRMWLITDDKTGVHFTGGGFCSNDVRKLFLDPNDTKKGCRDCLEDTFSVCTWPYVNSGDPSPLRIEIYS